ncbi:hypothetical protein I311_00489 [Cryptococcus gattii NT-10]|nr:hypothetical protein I311_00489 [Cryptococcus gattii NT-10]
MGSASSRPATRPQDTMSNNAPYYRPPSPPQPPFTLPPRPGNPPSDILQLRAAALTSRSRSQDPRPPALAEIFGAATGTSSTQQAPVLLERISKPKPSLADRIGKPNLPPAAPDDKEEGEISDGEYEPRGGPGASGSMLARRIGGTRVAPVQAAFSSIRSKAMHHISAPPSRPERPASTRFEPAAASRNDIWRRPPRTSPPPANIELPSPRIQTPPLPSTSTSIDLTPSTPPKSPSPSLPPGEQAVEARTPPLPLQGEQYPEAKTPPLPPQEEVFEAISHPNSPPGTPPISSTFEFSDSKETWTRPPTPEFEDAAGGGRTWDSEDATMNEQVHLELESHLAAPASNAPEEENDDYMDIIRNLLYKGVDPEVLIARGASPEHVMAVCREIIQGTRERNDSAEQETPDVDYSREASMARSENMVDDEMLGDSPESDVTVEPLAYRLDSAQLVNSASVESPRPQVVRLPEPHFSTPVLSPPSLPTVRTVAGVFVESGPRPHLESILAPSLSVPDTITSSGDEPAQSVQPALSTQPTGLASLPPRPISRLPSSGSPSQSPVPSVQLPMSSSPANEQQPSKKKKKKKKKATQEEASANTAINASTEAGPGPSTMASQAISQTSQAAQPQPPQPSQPHPHPPPPPAKPRKMSKKEKKAARAQAAAAAASAAAAVAPTSTSVSGPMGLPPRPAMYSETFHAAPPYVPDPYAMYPAHLQPRIQPHFQPPYPPQRPPQPNLPQAFQQPAMFDMNGRVPPLSPVAQGQPPPPPTAAPPLPPGSPPVDVDLQTVLSESKRKVLESMRRRKEASLQPSAPVTPALETPTLETPALASTDGSIGTGILNRSVQEEAAALEREFLGMHMSAASMASHAGPKSTTQSRSMSMEMDVDVDMDIDEPEEGEILVVSPRLSAPPPAAPPAPTPAPTSTLSASATLPERPASAGSNLPVVRRGIKRAHAEDLNESRTVSAPAARPPPAARRLFCAPLRPHQLKISLDEDSESDDSDNDDEDDEEKRRIEADEKQRKLAEEIARLKAQIAMKKRRKLQSGQASEAATPTSTDMGSNADTDVQEASTPQDQGNLNLVKSAVIQSIGKPRGEGLIRSSTPADIKQLTQELAQVEAQKEAYEEAMQVHDPTAGVAAPHDSGISRSESGTDKSENEGLALVVGGSDDHTSFHAYKPILSHYPQLSRTLIPLSSTSSVTASSSTLDPFLNVDQELLDSIMLINYSQTNPSMMLCSAEASGGKCADRNCVALHLNKTLIPSGKCNVSSSHLPSEHHEDLVEYAFESIATPQGRIGNADKAKEKIRIAIKLAKNSLATVSGGVERRQDYSTLSDSNEQYKELLKKVGQILRD